MEIECFNTLKTSYKGSAVFILPWLYIKQIVGKNPKKFLNFFKLKEEIFLGIYFYTFLYSCKQKPVTKVQLRDGLGTNLHLITQFSKCSTLNY